MKRRESPRATWRRRRSASHRQSLDHVWRPAIGALPFLGVRHSTLVKVADSHTWKKKTYNNAISALRRAFEFGYRDYPEKRDPAAALKSARIGKKDRPMIDPFSIQEAERLIAALHRDWGEAQGNYDEFRFFTGLRPSEQIALVVNGLRRQAPNAQRHEGAGRGGGQGCHQDGQRPAHRALSPRGRRARAAIGPPGAASGAPDGSTTSTFSSRPPASRSAGCTRPILTGAAPCSASQSGTASPTRPVTRP